MTPPAAPPFPRCEHCNGRMNTWAIRVCMECQLLPDADVVELGDRRVKVA